MCRDARLHLSALQWKRRRRNKEGQTVQSKWREVKERRKGGEEGDGALKKDEKKKGGVTGRREGEFADTPSTA